MAIDEMANNTPPESDAQPDDARDQALNPVEANLGDDRTDDDDKTQFKDDTFDTAPRGIMAFLALMLLFYIVYWFLVWFEIIIGRGA
jgi:hypothetical protein